jgi:hypothetical protein
MLGAGFGFVHKAFFAPIKTQSRNFIPTTFRKLLFLLNFYAKQASQGLRRSKPDQETHAQCGT